MRHRLSRIKKPKEFTIPLYGNKVWVSKGVSKEDFLKAVRMIDGDDLTTMLKYGDAITITIDYANEPVIWVWFGSSSLSDIVHEITHISHEIMRSVGMTLTDSSEEAYAYLNDFLFNKIHNIK